jgi:hypothetical protein
VPIDFEISAFFSLTSLKIERALVTARKMEESDNPPTATSFCELGENVQITENEELEPASKRSSEAAQGEEGEQEIEHVPDTIDADGFSPTHCDEEDAQHIDDKVALYLNDDEDDPYLPIEEQCAENKDDHHHQVQTLDNSERPCEVSESADSYDDRSTTSHRILNNASIAADGESLHETGEKPTDQPEALEDPLLSHSEAADENADNISGREHHNQFLDSGANTELVAKGSEPVTTSDDQVRDSEENEREAAQSAPKQPKIALTNAEIEQLVLPLPPHTRIRVVYCEPDVSPDEVVCYGKLFEMKRVRKVRVWDVSYILEDDDGDMSWWPTQLPPASGRNDPKILIYEIEAIARFPEGVGETREQKQLRTAHQAESAKNDALRRAAAVVHVVDDEDDDAESLAAPQRDARPSASSSSASSAPPHQQVKSLVAAMSLILGDSQTGANKDDEDDDLAIKSWIQKPAPAPAAEKPTKAAVRKDGAPEAKAKSESTAFDPTETPSMKTAPNAVAPESKPPTAPKSAAPTAKLLLEDDDEANNSQTGPPTKTPVKLPVKIPVAQALPLPAKPKVLKPLDVSSLMDDKKQIMRCSAPDAGSGTKLVTKSMTTPSVPKLQQQLQQQQRAPGSSRRDPTLKREPVAVEIPTVAEGTLFASPSELLASHDDDVVVPCSACRDPLSSLSLLWFTHLLTAPSCQGSPGRLSNNGARAQVECCQCKKVLTVAEQTSTMMHKRCRERKGVTDPLPVPVAATIPAKRTPPVSTYERKRSRSPMTSFRKDESNIYDVRNSTRPRSPPASTTRDATSVADRDYRPARSRTPPSAYSRDVPYVRPRSRSPPTVYGRDRVSSYDRDLRPRSPPSVYTRGRSPAASDYYRARPRSRSRSPRAYDSRQKSPPASTRLRSRTPPGSSYVPARTRSRTPPGSSYVPARTRSRTPPGSSYVPARTRSRSPRASTIGYNQRANRYVPPQVNNAPPTMAQLPRSDGPLAPVPVSYPPIPISEPRFISGVAGIKSAAETVAQTKNAPMYTKKGKLIQPASYTYVPPPSNAPPRVAYLMPPGAISGAPPSAPAADRKRSRSPTDYDRGGRDRRTAP